MNNLLSNCGLVDLRINASDKDLPVSVVFSTPAKSGWAIAYPAHCFQRPYIVFNKNCNLEYLFKTYLDMTLYKIVLHMICMYVRTDY